jgi:outer membrane protein assembly factor BamD (BamD/ComL family)
MERNIVLPVKCAVLLLLDIAADRAQWDELLKWADEFLKQFPQSEQRAYAQYRAGEAALQSAKLDRAVAELAALAEQQDEKVTKSDWYSSVYVLLAEAQFRAKDYPQVEATVAAFRERFPASPLLYHADEILGRSYKQRAMLPEARESFAKVTGSESGRRTKTAAKAQFHIAETFLIEKDYRTALAEYYKVYVNYQFPEWQALALFQAGQCDESLENWREATQSYENLIKEFPDNEYAARAQQRIDEIRNKAQ